MVNTPLGTAIKTSNLDLVKLLLKRGANPNCGECLHLAVEKGRADLCELLIDSGAKLDAMNANKDTPLLTAIRNNNFGTCQIAFETWGKSKLRGVFTPCC